jgi:hypothetical protein
MNSERLRELGYLHDSIVRTLTEDFLDPEARIIRIVVDCHIESGHPSWSGRRLVLVAHDVRLMIHRLWYTSGRESINSVEGQISPEARAQFLAHRPANSMLPGEEVAVVFHSGAVLEMVCASLTVEIDK